MSIETKKPEQTQEAKSPSLKESFASVKQELAQKQEQKSSENQQAESKPTRPQQGKEVVTSPGGLGDGETKKQTSK